MLSWSVPNCTTNVYSSILKRCFARDRIVSQRARVRGWKTSTWTASLGTQTRNLSSLCRCRLERAAGAPNTGRVQPHWGLRAAPWREDHQPVLLGLSHGRAPQPALPGPQQHRALHRAFAHQPRLHDVQRRLPSTVLVPEIHYGLTRLQDLGFLSRGLCPFCPAPHHQLRS